MKLTTDHIKHIKKLYWQENKSIRDIAEEYGTVMAVVQRFMVKHNIPRRAMGDRKWSLEDRQKLSDIRVNLKLLGDKNPNWKGGVSKSDRGGERYSWWRNSVKRRDNYICQICGADGKERCDKCHAKPQMHADHIKPWAKYPELRYELSNGRTLCSGCHYKLAKLGKSGELLGRP